MAPIVDVGTRSLMCCPRPAARPPQLIMGDLMYYFKDSAVGDPGNDSGDEGEDVRVVEESTHGGGAHSHTHGHSHGVDADGHVEGCPHHSHAHAHSHGGSDDGNDSGAGAMGMAGGDVIMDTEHEVRQVLEALGEEAGAGGADE